LALSIIFAGISYCQISDAANQVGADDHKVVIPGGLVEVSYEDGIVKHFDELLDAALEKDPTTLSLDRAVIRFRKPHQRIKAKAKDALNTIVPSSGFSH
jgi:hypothetical protein